MELGSKTFVQVDSDADGYTSSALLLNYLYDINPNYAENIIYRLHEGKQHGIILDTIPDDTKFVIIPDAGSNQFEEHKILKEKGIDVLVIDHHQAEKVSEDACIVNNCLCDYPNKTLSGVGMVFKVCEYIDKYIYNTNHYQNYYDLAALGIISDMMDLRNFETKQIIEKGLKNIKNPYFKEMVEKNSFSIGNVVTPISISFYVTPYINAVCRSGTMEEKEVLFKSMLDFKAYDLVPSTKRGHKAGDTEILFAQASRLCNNVKNRQKKSKDVMVAEIESRIEKENLLDNKILFVMVEPEAERNLVGLIANDLMGKLKRPVILVKPTIHDDEIWYEGSARAYSDSGFTDFRSFVLESECVEYAEGHEGAFGIGLKKENIEKFLKKTNEMLKDFDFSIKYDVDYIYNINNLNPIDISEIGSYKSLWGQNISEPLFAIEGIKVKQKDIKVMKETNIKLTIGKHGIGAVKFKITPKEISELTPAAGGYTLINLIGKFEINEWNGNTYPQIIIKDYEIIRKVDYDF